MCGGTFKEYHKQINFLKIIFVGVLNLRGSGSVTKCQEFATLTETLRRKDGFWTAMQVWKKKKLIFYPEKKSVQRRLKNKFVL
jgi:hypothetical protein